MSLMNKFKNERQRIKEEKAAEVIQNRKGLYSQGLESIETSLYAGKNVSKIDLIAYVQNEVLRISPIFAPIIMKPFMETNRNFIVSTNGISISIGKRFFSEPIEVVILEVLKTAVEISLGHYMLTRLKMNTSDFKIIMSFAMRETYSRITNTLIKSSPLSVGLVSSKMKFTQETIDRCLTPKTDREQSYWKDIPNLHIQEAVEQVIYAHFTRGDLSQPKQVTINVPHSSDTITFVIPANLIENYRGIKENKDKLNEIREKENKVKEQERQMDRRERAQQQQEQEESNSDGDGGESQESKGEQPQDGDINNGERSQQAENNTSQDQQEQGQQEQSQGQQDSQQSQQQPVSQQEQDQQQSENQQDQSQQQSNSQQEQQGQDEYSQDDWQQEQQDNTQNQQSMPSKNDVRGFGEPKQESEPQSKEAFGDSLKDYTEEELLDMLNQMAEQLNPETMQELSDRIEEKELSSAKSIINELKDMAKDNPQLQQEIQDAIEQALDNEKAMQDFKDKFGDYQNNISDMTQDQLQDLASEIANLLDEEELEKWNKDINEKEYSSYEEAIEDLMDSDYLSEESKEQLKERLEETVNELQEMLQNMQKSSKNDKEELNWEEENDDIDYSEKSNESNQQSGEQSQDGEQSSESQSSESQSFESQSSESQSSESQSSESQSSESQSSESQSSESQSSESQSSESQSSQGGQQSEEQVDTAEYADSKRKQIEDMKASRETTNSDNDVKNGKPDKPSMSDELVDELNANLDKIKAESANIPTEEIDRQKIEELKEQYKAEKAKYEDKINDLLEGLDEDLSDYMDTLENMECDMTENDYRDLINSMNQAGERQGGQGASSLAQRNIVEMFKVKVTWYTILEKMIRRYLPTNQPTFKRPNKKYLHSKIILPSNSGRDISNSIDYIKLYLDSSGSMTDKDLSILCSILKKLANKFPKKTEAYEFNSNLFPLKVRNGRLVEKPKSTGGTEIEVVLAHLKKQESGRVMSIIITDGGFWSTGWNNVRKYLEQNPREIMVILLTQGAKGYEEYIASNLGISKSRFKVIPIENDDILGVIGF